MKRLIIFAVSLLLLLSAFLFIPKSKTNFDMTLYLPESSMTRQGLSILKDNFDPETSIQMMISDVSVAETLVLITQIEQLQKVSSVLWLDDYVDLTVIPIDVVPDHVKAPFYQNNHALLTIVISTDGYDESVSLLIEDLRNIVSDKTIRLRGEAIENERSRDVARGEITKIMFLIIPIVIVILLLASHSWIEPVLILLTLGIAVLFNIATNGIFEHVSFITQSMALALQLALSIDYALFLIHRYDEELKYHEPVAAARHAFKHAFKSITASALTTIAGFSALFLMDYSIGLDIGLVLSKGILFSYLSTMLLLPILLVWFHPWIEKTKHKMLIPDFKAFFSFQHKFRHALLVIFIALLAFGLYGQSQVEHLFGTTALSSETDIVDLDQKEITLLFGPFQSMIILIPNGDIQREIDLANALSSMPEVLSVNTLVTQVDPNIPREFLPSELVGSYVGRTHTRFILQTVTLDENREMYVFVDRLKEVAGGIESDFYLIGSYSAIDDIRTSIRKQDLVISLVSIVAVGLIIGLMFKSFILPILLIGVIQGAIWLNLSYLYLTDVSILYIGYLVVMSIQLGATIDYAVLLSNRYLESRKSLPPKEAMSEAYAKSSLSILISGTILTCAGFAEGLFSDIASVTDIGMLLGRGALISSLMIFIFLPSILLLFDPLLYRQKRIKEKKQDMES